MVWLSVLPCGFVPIIIVIVWNECFILISLKGATEAALLDRFSYDPSCISLIHDLVNFLYVLYCSTWSKIGAEMLNFFSLRDAPPKAPSLQLYVFIMNTYTTCIELYCLYLVKQGFAPAVGITR
jgi:hypothetical protein